MQAQNASRFRERSHACPEAKLASRRKRADCSGQADSSLLTTSWKTRCARSGSLKGEGLLAYKLHFVTTHSSLQCLLGEE